MAAIASTSRSTKTRSKWRKKNSLARSRGRGWATKDLERERCQGAQKSNWGKRPAGAIAGPRFVRGFVLREPLPSLLLPGRDPAVPFVPLTPETRVAGGNQGTPGTVGPPPRAENTSPPLP